MIVFKRGQKVRHKMLFFNDVGAAADPTTVTFKLEYGDGTAPLNFTATSPGFAGPAGFTRVQVGWFEYIEKAIKPGVAKWRWESTGDPETSEEGKYEVEPGNFYP